MPLFTVTMKAGRAADEKNAISHAIHEASVNRLQATFLAAQIQLLRS